MDLSLDDLIQKKKMGSSSRGGARRGGGARGAGGMRRGAPPSARGRGSSYVPRRSAPSGDRFPQSSSVPSGQWSHDMYHSNGSRSNGRSNPQPLMSMPTASANSGPSKILISNLHPQVTDSDIRELFGEFGNLQMASVHFDSAGNSLGSAQVTYGSRSSAVRAKQQYNGVHLDRRPMRVAIEGESANGGGGSSRPMVKRLENNTFPQRRMGGGAPPSRRGMSAPRGAGRGRGGMGARGGRGGGAPRTDRKEEKTAEQLDAELDSYLSKARK